ncbi:HTH-type transcriptional regulator LutR [Halomonas lysinitropha]|uniref:HTH-type transcriptional regulator LutR n=2 Tax=Halomonas lysinitropha TaxID=2607506 RepID=A0A5K1I2N4_9GAMM|nr:HTH-type transcriptional regulator LutR [Halomonas lysinitropha]
MAQIFGAIKRHIACMCTILQDMAKSCPGDSPVNAKSVKNPQRPSVAEFLAEAIFSGVYRPGDFVPREIDLCEQFTINRSAVRSDLRRLVDVGIIERISGHGSKVREYEEWNILDPVVTDWITRYASPNPRIQREILAFRLDVEPYVAMTAARRAKARDLVAIEEAFEGMGKNLYDATCAEERRLHSDYDVAFHVAIFKATHNIVWSQLSHILRPSIYLLVSESNISTTDPEESLERHRQVMEHIRARNPREAFLAAQAVLEGTAKALGIETGDSRLGKELELL